MCCDHAHQHEYYHIRALWALQVLFTRGELAGRNFHYHFVMDRGMPYEVRLLPGSASMRPCVRSVAVRCQQWPSLAFLPLMHTSYQHRQSRHSQTSACLVPARCSHEAHWWSRSQALLVCCFCAQSAPAADAAERWGCALRRRR